MARKVKDQSLETRTARARLKARGKPHYRSIDPGLHLGYRKSKNGPGKWVVRLLVEGKLSKEGKKQPYVVDVIATADDLSDANAVDILNYGQALTKARELRDQRKRSDAGIASGPYTVSQALADYFKYLRQNGRPDHMVSSAEQRAASLIEPTLGGLEVASLTSDDLLEWRDSLVKAGARTRVKKGAEQRYRPIEDKDDLRARQATVNRIWATLRAALNHAHNKKRVLTSEWRLVKPFKGVDGNRSAFLTAAQALRLINASDPDFRLLVQAALHTGGRYGSLGKLRVRDFHPDAGTIDLRTHKGDGSEKTFAVILESDEAIPFFKRVCAGRRGDELMFVKDDGTAWGVNHQTGRMLAACERATIDAINFNQLRHTWASLALMAGVPLMVVAGNLGHRDTTMVQHHYGHLLKSYVKDALQAGAPRFGFAPDTKIVGIER